MVSRVEGARIGNQNRALHTRGKLSADNFGGQGPVTSFGGGRKFRSDRTPLTAYQNRHLHGNMPDLIRWPGTLKTFPFDSRGRGDDFPDERRNDNHWPITWRRCGSIHTACPRRPYLPFTTVGKPRGGEGGGTTQNENEDKKTERRQFSGRRWLKFKPRSGSGFSISLSPRKN